MAGLDSSSFKRDLEVVREALTKDSEERGHALAQALVQRSPYSLDILDCSLIHMVGISVTCMETFMDIL